MDETHRLKKAGRPVTVRRYEGGAKEVDIPPKKRDKQMWCGKSKIIHRSKRTRGRTGTTHTIGRSPQGAKTTRGGRGGNKISGSKPFVR